MGKNGTRSVLGRVSAAAVLMLTGVVVALGVSGSAGATGSSAAGEPPDLCAEPPSAGFTDVPPGKYYTLPIDWLVAKNITSGTSAGKYSPAGTVTRGQMATFL